MQLAAFCALRFGALTELRRADVDTDEGVLWITRAAVLADGKFVVKAPKSEAGVRDVAIPPHLLPMVRAHLLEHIAPGPKGLLFPARDDPNAHLRQSTLARCSTRCARRRADRTCVSTTCGNDAMVSARRLIMDVLFDRVAGLDVGEESVTVCVRLSDHGVTVAAMEPAQPRRPRPMDCAATCNATR